MDQYLALTQRQWAIVLGVGFGLAWVSTPSVPAAIGYALGSVPLAYLVMVLAARLAGDGSTDGADA